jgi:hypothetical protein
MLVFPFARPWDIAMFETASQSHYRVQQHAASGGSEPFLRKKVPTPPKTFD